MVTEMNYKSGDAECFLLLLCKLKPFGNLTEITQIADFDLNSTF